MFSNGFEFRSLVIEIYLEFEFCDLEFKSFRVHKESLRISP